MHVILIMIGVLNIVAAFCAPQVATAASVANRTSILTALGDADPREFSEQEKAVLNAADRPLAQLSSAAFWLFAGQGALLVALGVIAARNTRNSAPSATTPTPR